MSKNKKILLGLLMIFLIGITWVLLGDSKREYVGKITIEELDMIRNEVIKELPGNTNVMSQHFLLIPHEYVFILKI